MRAVATDLALVALVALAALGCAGGKSAPPGPPPPPPLAEWQQVCGERLHVAQQELAREEPAFAAAEVAFATAPARTVALVMTVADAEHTRFFDAAAEFKVLVEEKASAEPGELGGSAGGADDDSQASLNVARWTTARVGSLEAQIVTGHHAVRFEAAFGPAIDDCLR